MPSTKRDVEVSYLLLCYNQEKFVAEAVRSALDQIGPRMEIIVSDDCSHDNTFEIIQAEAKRYDGAHSLVVRRTHRNLGVVGHLNELVSLSSGRFIVVGAGDDVSRSDKVKKVYDDWRRFGALVLGCNPILIDETGRAVGVFYSTNIPGNFSCEAIISRRNACLFLTAFDRMLFDRFGPLSPELVAEDQALPMRASMIDPNSIRVIDEPLVNYRVHQESAVHSLKFSHGVLPIRVLRAKLDAQVVMHQGWANELLANLDSSQGAGLSQARELLERRLMFFKGLAALSKIHKLGRRQRKLKTLVKSYEFKWTELALLSILTLSPHLAANAAAMVGFVSQRKQP